MKTIIATEDEIIVMFKKAITDVLKEQKPKSENDNTLLSQQQAAQMLQVSIPTLIKMKQNNILPFSQIERKIYFKKQDILNTISALANTKNKG